MQVGKRLNLRKDSRQQSAMEYLMTYGWSILIIAIVLAALFSLGVFGNANLEPRAQPNSCRVYRPNGAGTTTNINLEGVCNGELPEYVTYFNGNSAWVTLPNAAEPLSAQTITFWMDTYSLPTGTNYPAAFGGFPLGGSNAQGGAGFQWNGGNWYYEIYNSVATAYIQVSGSYTPVNTWTFVAVSWNGTASANAMAIYINGALVVTGPGLLGNLVWTRTCQFCIGYGNRNPPFNGTESNFQVYDTNLDANTIRGLYLEGIGGAPVSPQYLTGWWPLNGDDNDYSGNNNNGVPTNTVFVSAWTSGYTPP